MHTGTQVIRTERLVLRPFEMRDARDMHKNWIADPKVQWNYGEPVYPDIESIEALLSKWIAAYAQPGFYRWAIVLAERGECIGQIAFCSVHSKNRLADVEYCIGRAYQGRGYAPEALQAVIEFTFTQTGLNRLQAFHRGKNQSSARVLQKAGLRREGALRQAFYYEDIDEYDDSVFYGITRADFCARATIPRTRGQENAPRR